SGNDPLVDGLLESDIGVAGSLGAEIPKRGEAGEQRVACVVGGPADPKRQRLLEHLVVPRRLVVWVKEDMRMGVDQPRQQRGSGELDHASVRGQAQRTRRSRALDLVTADQDEPTVVRFQGSAVENARGLEYDRRCGLSRSLVRQGQAQSKSGDARTVHGILR